MAEPAPRVQNAFFLSKALLKGHGASGKEQRAGQVAGFRASSWVFPFGKNWTQFSRTEFPSTNFANGGAMIFKSALLTRIFLHLSSLSYFFRDSPDDGPVSSKGCDSWPSWSWLCSNRKSWSSNDLYLSLEESFAKNQVHLKPLTSFSRIWIWNWPSRTRSSLECKAKIVQTVLWKAFRIWILNLYLAE